MAAPGAAAPADLPVPPTPLIDRTDERLAVQRLLLTPEVRLVTVVGPPGVGKTRLAMEVARAAASSFVGGSAFVPLGALGHSRLVPATIAQALHLGEAGDRPIDDVVFSYLRDRNMLLFLDNFEHVLDAAPSIAELLEHCAKLKLLISSRAPLRIRAEHVFTLGPLPVPAAQDLATVAAAPSAALLAARAAASRPGFAITAANAGAVAGICARLDGLPLALELAAARLTLLPPDQLLSKLSQRLPVLTTAPRDLPERHQTLRGAIATSYDLLPPEVQKVFRAMGVFAGGATLDAVTAIAGLDAEDAVNVLLDHSLIDRIDAAGAPRVAMLETIREFSLEQLRAEKEEEVTGLRHAEYFTELAGEAAAKLIGPEQRRWLHRLDADRDNLRAAQMWCFDTNSQLLGLQLIVALDWYWYLRGQLSEGSRWLEAALTFESTSKDPMVIELRARAAAGLGHATLNQGHFFRALEYLDIADSLASQLTDSPVSSWIACLRGYTLTFVNPIEAVRFLEQFVVNSQSSTSQREIALGLASLAGVKRNVDLDSAVKCAIDAVTIATSVGDDWLNAFTTYTLGQITQAGQNTERALDLYASSLGCLDEIYAPTGMMLNFVALADVTEQIGVRRGNYERAAVLTGLARQLGKAMATSLLDSLMKAQLNSVEANIVSEIGQAAFDAAVEKARNMSIEQAFAYAMEVQSHAALPEQKQTLSQKSSANLSEREIEVVRAIVQGWTNRQIAADLVVSVRTAESHVDHILNKLGLQSRLQIAVWAMKAGLIE